MPKQFFIGIQSGHQNIQTNIDPQLRPGTGAAGEEPFNVKVRDLLGEILIEKGFQIQLDDANANSNSNTLNKDFDFYLAIHAESQPPGGIVSAPDPSVDQANKESQRIVQAINDIYFNDTGIAKNPQIITNNMTFYYMWNVLTAKTACGIIECGALADPHDQVILNDPRRVAQGIAHGLCNAFGVNWSTTGPSASLSPSSSTSQSVSPSHSVSPSTSASPSAPPDDNTAYAKLVALSIVVKSQWSWFGASGWYNKLQQLRNILNG